MAFPVESVSRAFPRASYDKTPVLSGYKYGRDVSRFDGRHCWFNDSVVSRHFRLSIHLETATAIQKLRYFLARSTTANSPCARVIILNHSCSRVKSSDIYALCFRPLLERNCNFSRVRVVSCKILFRSSYPRREVSRKIFVIVEKIRFDVVWFNYVFEKMRYFVCRMYFDGGYNENI